MCEDNLVDITVKVKDKEYCLIMSPKDNLKLLRTILGKKLNLNPEELKLYHNTTLLSNERISSFKAGDLVFELLMPADDPDDPDEHSLFSLALSASTDKKGKGKCKSKESKAADRKSKPY